MINFLVNCPTGSMFVKSVNATPYMRTGEKLFELLDKFVEVGEKRLCKWSQIVKVITCWPVKILILDYLLLDNFDYYLLMFYTHFNL